VAILTGTGDAFCAGAHLRTHVPEWADVGPSERAQFGSFELRRGMHPADGGIVPHDELMAAAEDMVARILRNDRRAVESAKETIFEVIGRTLDEQLKVECLFGYALCGGNPAIVQRSQEFFDKKDRGRVGTKATAL
jgi:enoyl-CoA hydratase/carnithine racemase